MKKIYGIILVLLMISISVAVIAYSDEKITDNENFDEFHTKNLNGEGICISPDIDPTPFKTNILGVRI